MPIGLFRKKHSPRSSCLSPSPHYHVRLLTGIPPFPHRAAPLVASKSETRPSRIDPETKPNILFLILRGARTLAVASEVLIKNKRHCRLRELQVRQVRREICETLFGRCHFLRLPISRMVQVSRDSPLLSGMNKIWRYFTVDAKSNSEFCFEQSARIGASDADCISERSCLVQEAMSDCSSRRCLYFW